MVEAEKVVVIAVDDVCDNLVYNGELAACDRQPLCIEKI